MLTFAPMQILPFLIYCPMQSFCLSWQDRDLISVHKGQCPHLAWTQQSKHGDDSKERCVTFPLALGVGGGYRVDRSQDDLCTPTTCQTGGEGLPRARVSCQAGPTAQSSSCSLEMTFHGAAWIFQHPLCKCLPCGW